MAKKTGNRKSRQTDEPEAGTHTDAPEPAVETADATAPRAADTAGGPEAAADEPSATPREDAPAAAGERAAAEQLLRLRADFENYKRRVLREKDELYRRATEDLMAELLPVLDHLEMALKAAEDRADDPFVQGVRLVGDQLMTALGKHGLAPIDAAGEPFDPNLHEAVSHLPSPDTDENHVMVQTRRGYRLGDRLLRAAQVVVSSGAPAAAATAETE